MAASNPDDWKRRRKLIFGLFKKAGSNWLNDKVTRLAASIAFFTMLSIGPLLLITLHIIGVIFGPAAAEGHLERYFAQMVGPEGAEVLEDIIAEAGADQTGAVATAISLGILIFTASYMFAELQDAMNTVWNVEARQEKTIWRTIRRRLLSFAMVISLSFLLLVSLIISAVLATITAFFMPAPGAVGQAIDFLVSLAVISGIFAVMFKYVPDVELTWRNVWPGALMTGILFSIGQFLLAMYLSQAFAVGLYGAAGSLVALLLWVYYSAQIVFFGAEFTKVYVEWRRGGPPPVKGIAQPVKA